MYTSIKADFSSGGLLWQVGVAAWVSHRGLSQSRLSTACWTATVPNIVPEHAQPIVLCKGAYSTCMMTKQAGIAGPGGGDAEAGSAGCG